MPNTKASTNEIAKPIIILKNVNPKLTYVCPWTMILANLCIVKIGEGNIAPLTSKKADMINHKPMTNIIPREKRVYLLEINFLIKDLDIEEF